MRHGSRPRILLVEDEPEARQGLAELLELHGYQVTGVGSAEAGLEQLGRSSYDGVVTDHDLPGESGSWMLEQAARRGLMRRTGRMVVTAHPALAGAAGVTVLRKPVDVARFLEASERLVEHPRLFRARGTR